MTTALARPTPRSMPVAATAPSSAYAPLSALIGGLAAPDGAGASCETPPTPGLAATDIPAANSDPSAPGFLGENVPRGADGNSYPRDLLEDILLYRDLRVRLLRGEQLSADALAQYRDLEDGLHTRGEADPDEMAKLRAFHRFEYPTQAKLGIETDRGSRLLDVDVENISAGGVKLHAGERLAEGDRVWLLMPRAGGTPVVIPSRVAWVGPSHAGLMFAGAPARR